MSINGMTKDTHLKLKPETKSRNRIFYPELSQIKLR